jgi:UDPglucose 6-dehydrogenase
MNIAMMGAGYVGLTSGACLAELGHHVVCFDVNRTRISVLQSGEVPIHEPRLAAMLRRNVKRGRLAFTFEIAASVADADAIFLAVGTPSLADGSIDLTYVEDAAQQIAKLLPRDCVVVVKSTVVPGTARRVREIIAETRGALDFSVASNPEFLREGSAVSDFMSPDRIVVGADEPRAVKVLEAVYAKLITNGARWLTTSTTNAEITKYAANSLLALKIGFINEVADLCEAVGGDITSVATGVGLDPRIGAAFLTAGPGFGGSCFPKDTRALAAIGRRRGAPQRILETLIEGNERRKEKIAKRILAEIEQRRGARVAVLGIAFKGNTDDVRESAALTIIPILQRAGCQIAVHDPKVKAAGELPGVTWHRTPYFAAAGADIVVILTEWDQYRKLDSARLRRTMRGSTILDYRGLLDAEAVADAGVRYLAVGRATGATNGTRNALLGATSKTMDRIAAMPA